MDTLKFAKSIKFILKQWLNSKFCRGVLASGLPNNIQAAAWSLDSLIAVRKFLGSIHVKVLEICPSRGPVSNHRRALVIPGSYIVFLIGHTVLSLRRSPWCSNGIDI